MEKKNNDMAAKFEDKQSDDHVKLVHQLVDLRNSQCQQAADIIYKSLSKDLDKVKESQKDDTIINPIDMKPVKIIRTEERLALFQEVDTLLERYKNLQNLLELNKKLEMNETHAVLFGGNAEASSNQTKEANKSDDTFVIEEEVEKEDDKGIKETLLASEEMEITEVKETKVEKEEEIQQSQQLDKLQEDDDKIIKRHETNRDEDKDDMQSLAKQRRKSKPIPLHHSMVIQDTTSTNASKIGTPVRVRRSVRRASTNI